VNESASLGKPGTRGGSRVNIEEILKEANLLEGRGKAFYEQVAPNGRKCGGA
jgi:hypothetical protein